MGLAPQDETSYRQSAELWGDPLPNDRAYAMQVLDALSGGRAASLSLFNASQSPRAEFTGSQPERFYSAQSQTATARELGAGSGSLRGPAGRLLCKLNPLLTAAQLLQELRGASERTQVEGALKKFGLDRNSVADVYAARAYVWSTYHAPLLNRNVPASGPLNERVAVAIMRHERGNPGTLGLMTNGNTRAYAAIQATVSSALAGTPSPASIVHERRKSAIADPELSTSSTAARAILGIVGNQSWIAHHLIPFAVVRDLPAPFQRDMAASGWRIDSAENLVPLPRNLPTYLGPTNIPRRPWHGGSHPNYSADVAARVRPLAGRKGQALRQALLRIEMFFGQQLITDIARYHQMLR